MDGSAFGPAADGPSEEEIAAMIAEMQDFAPPGVQVVRKPGMAAELFGELGPLLADQGLTLDNPDNPPDLDQLNAALAQAVERHNLETFTPIREERAEAMTVLRLCAGAIADGDPALAKAILRSLEPEPADPDTASIAHVIGTGLGLLDTWHTDPTHRKKLLRASPADRYSTPDAALLSREMLKTAREGRAFAELDHWFRTAHGPDILDAVILAVTATLAAWAKNENTTVTALAKVQLTSA